MPDLLCCVNQVVCSAASVLKPGTGRVYVRDYAQGDLAQHRLSSTARQQKLAPDFYLRMDGTRAYFFTEAGACNPGQHSVWSLVIFGTIPSS